VYDLLDVGRELMSKVAGRFWKDAADAYQAGDLAGVQQSGGQLLALLADLDAMLGSHKAFLLGPQLQRARRYAADSSSSSGSDGNDPGMGSEQQQQQLSSLYERNLRTQLTIWGTSIAAGDSEVSDYANKEWSGLISGFYLPRWQAWLGRLEQDLLIGRSYDATAWRLEVLNMTYSWVQLEDGASLPAEPRGDPLTLARHAYEHYGTLLAPGGGPAAASGVQMGLAGGGVENQLERPAVVYPMPAEEMNVVA
jgi:alpha-N-acetylglucosaminidase